jgi:hypothetical protein
VAPVIAYVPEGSIDPPTGHMRGAGTISIPAGAFEQTLEGLPAACSGTDLPPSSC